jgi:putative ABC transport system permease protein
LSIAYVSGLLPIRLGRRSLFTGWRSGLTLLIAWRNLVHDRVRLAVTLIGIAFSTILMGIQLGMLLDCMHTTSTLVDHGGADIWIAAHGVRAVDLATPLEERRRFQALEVDGVAAAESYLLQFFFWKKGDGVREIVIVIGVEPDAEMGMPWGMTSGQNVRNALAVPDGVIIDRLYANKLGVDAVGQVFEINDHRVRVTGFTEGIRTFTQSPYVFTSLRTARSLANRADNDKGLTYVLIRLARGFAPQSVVAQLAARMPDVDILLPADFSIRSRAYWLFTTGAGATLISSSILALLVGIVIAAQTLYASTMDRLPEYATIRAMGGPKSYLYKIVIKQAVIGGLLGYLVGISLVLLLAHLARNSSSAPEAPWWLASGIAAVTVLMCIIASLVSLKKVTSIDPVKVFR